MKSGVVKSAMIFSFVVIASALTCRGNVAMFDVAVSHLGGTDRTFVSYDFGGRPVLTESVHTCAVANADTAIVQQVRRTFDDFGREVTVSHRFGREGEWMELAANSYDAVGRLVATGRGGAADLQTDYALDIRSRLTSITTANYYQHLEFTPAGNVSRMQWWGSGIDERERQYDFTYDKLGRLTAADYGDTGSTNGHYSTSYSYDLNGNILTLQRSGLFNVMSSRPYRLVDDLTMTYEGNRLVSVSDAVFGPYDQGSHHFVDRADEEVELTYDANGNTLTDLNRELVSAIYDINNQPRQMTFADGSTAAYLYDAAGVRHRTLHRVAEYPQTMPYDESSMPDDEGFYRLQTDYCGAMLYENRRLKQIFVDGGYIRLLDEYGEPLSAPEYHFFVRDHLGNNRLDISVNAATTAEQPSTATVHQLVHYYPFGMPMDCVSASDYQRWLFGDKEFDRTHGLDLYDQAARQYDPTLGRFRSMDSLAEKYYPTTPYLFCAANPLRNIDPSGTVVIASDENSQRNIRYTLTKEESKFVKFNKKGVLDNSKLQKCGSNSLNMTALKAISSSKRNNIFSVCGAYIRKNEEVELKGNKKNGDIGVTLTPNHSESPSPDENVYIIVSIFLPEDKQVETTAHEAYAHAYFYELKEEGADVNPFHEKEAIVVPCEPTEDNAFWPFENVWIQVNQELEDQIKSVVKQAAENYKSHKK